LPESSPHDSAVQDKATTATAAEAALRTEEVDRGSRMMDHYPLAVRLKPVRLARAFR
jgi:hypothetical protein